MTSRHRCWCITINNWTTTDKFGLDVLFKKCNYGIYGEEIGKKGTPHLQAYVHLANPLSLEALKKSIPRGHFIVAAGSDEENQAYCSKDGVNIKEVGVISVGQGTRTDIKAIAALIKNQEITLEDLMFEYPDMYVKYSRSFEKMFNAVMKPRDEPPQVFWRFGLAGTGKTRYVIDTFGIENIYIKDGTPWWDGYNQQKVILIDDFDNTIPYRTLLRILDRYVYQGQVKGSYVQINSPFIYITCEHPPDRYWKGNEFSQVFRRLTSVKEIKKNMEVDYNAPEEISELQETNETL